MINPNTDCEYNGYTGCKIYFNPRHLGDLYIFDKDKQYRYDPKDDITVLELSLVMTMFISGLIPSFNQYEHWRYVKEHNLERHFVEQH
jgi:hypothetical protein